MNCLKTCSLILVATACTVATKSFSQTSDSSGKYRFSVGAGALTTIAKRGPHTETEVSNVRFLHPWSKSLSGYFDIALRPNLYVGLVFGYDEYNFGYEADHQNNPASVSIVSGLNAANDVIGVFKAGVRVVEELKLTKRFRVEGALGILAGAYPHSSYIEDTSQNIYTRSPRRDVWYVVKPSEQNNHLKVFMLGQLAIRYSLFRYIDVGVVLSYQQGFSSIVKDTTTIIRPYEPGGPRQHDYWTTVNGTSAGFQIKLGYHIP